MLCTCDNVQSMAYIQIRNVPDDLHRKLKIRAAQAGMTLSDYLLAEIRRLAELPTMEEMVARVRGGELHDLEEDPAMIIRRWRDAT